MKVLLTFCQCFSTPSVVVSTLSVLHHNHNKRVKQVVLCSFCGEGN